MNKVISFILSLLLFSCANSDKEISYSTNSEIESNTLEHEIELENITLESLASDRLADYFELVQLKIDHPEFEEDIQRQLEVFSKEGFLPAYRTNNFSIENIRGAGENNVLSDSVQRIKLYYDLISQHLTKTDSIHAYLTSKTFMLDGIETKATKISFSTWD